MELKKPLCLHEFICPSKLPGILSALSPGIFLSMRNSIAVTLWPLSHCSWTHAFFLKHIFPNQLGGIRILKTSILRTIFLTPDEDPSYNPLLEDRASPGAEVSYLEG